jgi:hypothetical protein
MKRREFITLLGGAVSVFLCVHAINFKAAKARPKNRLSIEGP